MRPSHPPPSVCYGFGLASDLILAMGNYCSIEEANEIYRLAEMGLPPVTSLAALSTMLGYNPGFVWSLVNKTKRHYRYFEIPKGRHKRAIEAPKVALKNVQRWLAGHFSNAWTPNPCVHGFVPGRSHISAASVHLEAHWVYSIDIQDFFPSTDRSTVGSAIHTLGYRWPASIELLQNLCCLNGRLPQGAPTSPVLSNVAMNSVDIEISQIASAHGCKFTRYADDLVFSGIGSFPNDLISQVDGVISRTQWKVAESKRTLSQLPSRLKVHGLLVHGQKVRLTKGYRNRIRALRHMHEAGKLQPDSLSAFGHLQYASQVDRFREVPIPPETDVVFSP